MLAFVAGCGALVVRGGLEDARSRLQARADLVQQEAARHLASGDAALVALVGLYQATEAMSSSELNTVAEEMLAANAHLTEIAYLAWVEAGERDWFEQDMHTEGRHQFRIRDFSPEGRLGPIAGPRDAYLPVAFLEPLTPTSARLLGADMLDAADLRGTLETAFASGAVEAVAQLGPGGRAFLVAKATYFGTLTPETPEERREQVSGAFLLRIDLDGLLADLATANPELAISLEVSGGTQRQLGEVHPVSAATSLDLATPSRPLRLTISRSLTHHEQELLLTLSSWPDAAAMNLWQSLFVVAMAALFAATAVYAMRDRRLTRLREREAAEAMYQEKERAHVTLQSIGDGVVTADNALRVQYMNPIAEALTGWSNASAIGHPLTDVVNLVHEHDRSPAIDPAAPSLEALNVDLHLLLVRRDGVASAVDHTASMLRDSAGDAQGMVLVIRDVTRERELANELAYQARHDPLTGLPNRREFEARLAEALNGCDGEHRHALCYLDLDQFKLVNDTCGHVAGDQLLKQVSALLGAELRDGDLLARLGGDEFGVLLRSCNLARANEIAERLRNALEAYRFEWHRRAFELSVSIGVVPISDASGTIGDVQSAADLACYAAKDRGRNCVHVYDPSDQVIARHQGEMQWHARIKKALVEDRYVLYWQRMRALNTDVSPGEIREFLVRMRSPGGELISPAAFIPAAERYSLMADLDRWVIEHALEVIRDCGATPDQLLFSINLSGQSVGQVELADFVIDRIGAFDVDPRLVCFEITETAAISNYHEAVAFIERLRDLGCRFALDDFGAGLSSFGYLKHLPLDYLKIDGQFIKDLLHDPVDTAMVRAIDGIARVLGVRTVAEMVETEAVVAKLHALGIDYAQGFHIARPEPVDAPGDALAATPLVVDSLAS